MESNYDYYTVKVRLQDIKWHNDYWVDPWFSKTFVKLYGGSSNDVLDYDPTAGLISTQFSITFVAGITIYLPAGYIYYNEAQDGPCWKSTWDVQGAILGIAFNPVWKVYSEYAIKYQVSEGAGISTFCKGTATWYLNHAWLYITYVEYESTIWLHLYGGDEVGD